LAHTPERASTRDLAPRRREPHTEGPTRTSRPHGHHAASAGELGGTPTVIFTHSSRATCVPRAPPMPLPGHSPRCCTLPHFAMPLGPYRDVPVDLTCADHHYSLAYKRSQSSPPCATPLVTEPLSPCHWHPGWSSFARLLAQPPNHPGASPRIP
jgi:hypothetical protein